VGLAAARPLAPRDLVRDAAGAAARRVGRDRVREGHDRAAQGRGAGRVSVRLFGQAPAGDLRAVRGRRRARARRPRRLLHVVLQRLARQPESLRGSEEGGRRLHAAPRDGARASRAPLRRLPRRAARLGRARPARVVRERAPSPEVLRGPRAGRRPLARLDRGCARGRRPLRRAGRRPDLRGAARRPGGGDGASRRPHRDRCGAGAARPDLQRPPDPCELVGGGRADGDPPRARRRVPRVAERGRDRRDRAAGGRSVRAGRRAEPVGEAGIVRHMSSGRPRLRVLFFAGGPRFYLRQFSSLVAELAARGHEVHVAFQPTKGELAEESKLPGVTHGLAPARPDSDGWRSVAWLVRGLADLARYADPRFQRAPLLRQRMSEKITGRLRKSDEFEPLARRFALRLARRLSAAPDPALSARVIRTAARLERAVPTSPEIDRFVRGHAPDVVVATPVVNRASTQVEFLKSARRLGIPAATLVASWDNLTNKGLLKWVPERVFVWNEQQRREAVELHGIPPERVVATGAQLFDPWFERRPSTERDEFVRRLGLDPAEPYVLYTCSNPAMTDTPESEFVREWVAALRGAGDERLRRIGIAIRPHPNDLDHWREVDLTGFANVAVRPREGTLPVTDDARAEFFDSLAHSAAVVGINTTALNEDAAGAERRRRFVESFVRPHGLDKPATPIFADAIEELATLPVERWRPSALRLVLALEARLCARRPSSARRSKARPAAAEG